MSIPLKVCPKHEQAYRVTERCPYCEDAPASVGAPVGEPLDLHGTCWQLLRGMADGMVIVDSLGSGYYQDVAGRVLAPTGLLAWSGAPWRVVSSAPGFTLEVFKTSLTTKTKDVYRSPVLPLGSSYKDIQAAWSAL